MTQKLIWTGPKTALEALDVSLTEILYPPADAVVLLKDDVALSDAEATWRLEAYFSVDPDSGSISALTEDQGLTAPQTEGVPDKDWVAHALEGLGIVQVGAFKVFGRHDAEKAAALPGFPIQVEANQAFGTGHHPTTEGCLTALSDIQDINAKRVLDLGTGSGVLAMAARHLWPTADILATDNDPPSVDIARENAATNGLKDITFIEAEGVTESVKADGPYDLVIANILAQPLIDLASDIAQVLTPSGYVLIAGLLDRQEDRVLSAYEGAGLASYKKAGTETWPVHVLRTV